MKKKDLLIFSISLILIACFNVKTFAQPVTIYIYAAGSAESYITGNSSATVRTDGNIVSESFPTAKRGYAVFDLSFIPAGAIIDSVNTDIYVTGYSGFGTASGWTTYGIAGHLDTATTAASLYADIVSGTVISTDSYGSGIGDALLSNTAAATSFIQSNIGNKITLGFTGGTRTYTIEGETGTGSHAPYMAITYCALADAGTVSGPSSVCPGNVVAFTDAVTGGTWSASNGNATVDGIGNVTGVTSGKDTIIYSVTNACGTSTATAVLTVIAVPSFTVTANPASVCSGTGTQLSAAFGSVVLLQQDFNTSVAPWTVDSTGGVNVLPGANWKNVPSGYVNELGIYNSPDNSAFMLINGDTSGSSSITVARLISPSFSTANLTDATLTFQQFYENFNDINVDVDISTDGGAVWTQLANYASGGSGSEIGTQTSFEPETISLAGYLGYPNVMLRFYYNSPYGYSWAVDSVVVSGTPQAPTWTSASGTDLYLDPTYTTPYVAGTTVDTVYALPASVTTSTNFTYYANISNACSITDSVIVSEIVPTAPIMGSNVICTGVTEVVTNAVTGGTWSTTNGNVTVATDGTVTGITAGIDTILYTTPATCSSVVDTFLITVNQSANAGVINGTPNICLGATVTFTDTTGDAGGFWFTYTGNASVDGTGNVTGLTAGDDSVYYVVSNTCGAAFASYGVDVLGPTSLSVSIVANPGDTSCFGLAVTYIAMPVNGGSVPLYQWTVNGAVLGTTDTFVYTPNNGDTVAVLLKSNAACLVDAIATDTVIMTVNGGIVPTVSIYSNVYGDSACSGTTVPYFAITTHEGATPSYLWLVNSAPTGSGNPFYYTPNDGDTIRCILVSSLACAIPDSVTSDSVVMSVFTSEDPSVTISANPGDTVCNGTAITFTAHPIFGGLDPFFRWTVNGVNVATGPNYTFVPGVGDSIYCTLGSNSTCRTADFVLSDTTAITVDTVLAPIVNITALLGLNVGTSIPDTLVATVTNATVASYQWIVNGVAVPGATNAYFVAGDTVAATETITCETFNANSCHTPGSSTVVVTIADTTATAVQQVTAATIDAQLLPNPNKGSFLVKGYAGINTAAITIEITDIIGQVVYKEQVPVQNGVIRSQVSLDNSAPNGVYLMHLVADNASQVIRFTVNR